MSTTLCRCRFRSSAFGSLLAAILLLGGCSSEPKDDTAAASPPPNLTEPAETELAGIVALLEERRWEEAETLLRDQDPNTLGPVFHRTLLATVLAEQGHLEKARDLFALNLEEEPEAALHAYNLGAVFRRMGQPEPALEAFERSAEIGGMDPILLDYNRRLALIELHRSEELDEDVMRRLSEEPPPADWLMTAAAISLHRGFINEAAELLEAARDRIDSGLYAELINDRFFREFAAHPEIAPLMLAARPELKHLPRAAEAFQQGDFDAVITHATQALEAEELPATALSLRALARFGMGQREESLEDFENAVNLEPGNAGMWLNYGEALRALGHFSSALEAYQRAVYLQPENSLYALKKGLTYLELGETAPAALTADPGVALALELGKALDQGGTDEAAHLLGELRRVATPDWTEFVLNDAFFKTPSRSEILRAALGQSTR